MGKAKQQLLAARESYYETNQEIEIEIEIELENDEEYIEEEKKYYLLNTSFILRNHLMEYTDNCVLPLCEYLDFNNVENYVNWLLNHG